jgi:type I restriction enzyme S subunit
MANEQTVLGTGRTGGRDATTGVIPGRYVLAVGFPELPTPRGWKWTSLADVTQLESGHTPSRKHPEYWDGDVPWIGIRDAVENHGRTIHDTTQHVTEDGLANSSARLLPKNTVCLSRTASVGYVVVMGRPMATSQDFVNWVCGPQIDPQFLKYVLLSENEALWRFASGTTHQTIYYPEVKAFHVCLPPPPEQKVIAKILSDLDSRIELSRRINKTLGEIAKTVFHRWFIDFEFPNEEGKPYKSSGGAMVYDKDLARRIPSGWRSGRLEEFLDLDKGLSYKGKFLSDEGIPLINLGTIAPDAGFIREGLKHYVGEYKETQLVKVGDIVIANTDITQNREVLGSPVIVPPYLGSDLALITHHIFAVRNKSSLPTSFIYHLLQSTPYRNRVAGFATGTTVLALPRDTILDLVFAVPDEKTLATFEALFSVMNQKMNLSIMQSSHLSQVRDTLLPKLMSGKIRVPVEVG